MARPISLGLHLTGQDAIDFDEYNKNPTTTEEGRLLFEEAQRRVVKRMENKDRLYNMTMAELRELIMDLPDDLTVKDYFMVGRF